jgi:RNA recognition motif-containing protein
MAEGGHQQNNAPAAVVHVRASTVFVRRVPPGATRADVEAAFEAFGTIKEGEGGVTILPQKTRSDTSLNAVVEFEETYSAAAAVRAGTAGRVRLRDCAVTVVENRGDRRVKQKNSAGRLQRGSAGGGGLVPSPSVNIDARTAAVQQMNCRSS